MSGRLRWARAGVAVFLAAFALLLVVLIVRAPRPETPVASPRPVPPPPAEMPVEGPVESAAETFDFAEERHGVTVTRIRAGQVLGIEGGSRVLSDIEVEMRPEPERRPDHLVRLHGRAGRFDVARREIALVGGADLRLGDDQALRVEDLTYSLETRIASSAGPVTFELGAARGTAGGLRADLGAETVQLVDGVDVTLAGTETRAGLSLQAAAMNHNRRGRTVALRGRVRLRSGTTEWSGEEWQGQVLADGTVSGLGPRGGRLTVPGPGATLVAETWEFTLAGEGGLTHVGALGAARLEIGTAAGLEAIEADRIDLEPTAAGDAFVLTARGSGHGRPRAALRLAGWDSVTADRLRLETTAATPAARFDGAVEVRGADGVMHADRLDVEENGERAVLSGASPVEVAGEGWTMSARRIVVRRQGAGTAEGDVRVGLTRPREEGPVEPWLASARRAAFTTAGGTVRLEGEVRARRGEQSLQADWLTLERDTDRGAAGGGVTTLSRSIATDGREDLIRVTADLVSFAGGTREATYSGGVRAERGGIRLGGERLEIQPEAEGGHVFRLSGGVTFEESGRRGGGDRLTFRTRSETAVLEGDDGRAWVRGAHDEAAVTGRILTVARGMAQVAVEGGPGGRARLQTGDRAP